MKDIVIIANFVAGLHGTDNNRFTYLANELCKDNKVELIASTFCHGEKKRRSNIFEFPFKITLLEEPGYKKNVCLKRFWSHYIWGRNVLEYIKNRKKPEVIYCAIPSLTAASKVSRYCKKNGIHFIIDIQDLWPEAFQMVFNVPVISRLLFSPFGYLANVAYRNADEIVAVSQTYVDRALAVNKKCPKGLVVFLGTNLENFDNNVSKHIENMRKKYPKEGLWLGYCGTLGKSYDLLSVFDALYELSSNSKSFLRFIVMGDGPRRSEFEEFARQKRLDVFFTGKIPYDEMCALLSMCDFVVNPIVGSSVASIINKHADYAAVGRPVINTQNSAEYMELVSSFNMGFNCQNGNVSEIVDCISKLTENSEVQKRMGENARKCAEEKFNRQKTYSTIVNLIVGQG